MAKPITGRHVLAAMLAFFGVIVLVNGIFVYAALTSWTGIDTENAYVRGLGYNDTLAEARRQAGLGWQVEAGAARQDAAVVLWLTAADRGGQPLSALRLDAALRRPTQEALDRPLAFAHAGGGRYEARIEALPAGRWQLAATATGGDDAVYRVRQDLWLP